MPIQSKQKKQKNHGRQSESLDQASRSSAVVDHRGSQEGEVGGNMARKGKGKPAQPQVSGEGDDTDLTGRVSDRSRAQAPGGDASLLAPQAGANAAQVSSSPDWDGIVAKDVDAKGLAEKVKREVKALEKFTAQKMKEAGQCMPKGQGFKKFCQINYEMQAEWEIFKAKLDETLAGLDVI